MTVYRRNGSDVLSYDFYIDGVRYSGSTGSTERDEALQIERTIKAGILTTSPFCRSVLRRAKRTLPKRDGPEQGYVYFLRSRYFIKIGYSNDPEYRIKTISTATPDDCELLFFVKGSLELERKLHEEFSACHYQKEWFFLCGKLRSFVDQFSQSVEHQVPHDPPFEQIEALVS